MVKISYTLQQQNINKLKNKTKQKPTKKPTQTTNNKKQPNNPYADNSNKILWF